MTIYHIVLFEYQDGLSPEQIQQASEGMVALDQKCLHPKTGEKYVRNRIGGVNNSSEGMSMGFTHGYICEFDNEEDRTYYLQGDQAHKDWVQWLKPYLKRAQVCDFIPGVHV